MTTRYAVQREGDSLPPTGQLSSSCPYGILEPRQFGVSAGGDG